MVSVIVLAAGIGKRFGSKIPKQFHKVEDESILEITLKRLKRMNLFDEFVIVTRENYIHEVYDLAKRIGLRNYTVVKGGETRNESILNGFFVVSDDVVVHDSVRPLTSKETFEKVIEKLRESDVVTGAQVITGNLAHINGDQIDSILNRNEYVIGEAPTVYKYSVVQKILESVQKDKSLLLLPHDIQIPLTLGFKVSYVITNEYNLKITYREDLEKLKKLMKLLEE